MKKVLIILMAVILASSFAFAEEKEAPVSITPYVDKGDLLANVGIGWGGLSGGAELTFYRIDIANILPLTFGAAARVAIDPGIFSIGWTTFGVGAFGTAHVGFKSLNLPDGLSWASKFDAYAGLGLGFATGLTTNEYYTPRAGLGISTFEGASYYLSDNFAINFEYGYIGRIRYDWLGYIDEYSYPLWYSTIGVILKL
jgi:hypothetical protein